VQDIIIRFDPDNGSPVRDGDAMRWARQFTGAEPATASVANETPIYALRCLIKRGEVDARRVRVILNTGSNVYFAHTGQFLNECPMDWPDHNDKFLEELIDWN
jgi:hypothetical protein